MSEKFVGVEEGKGGAGPCFSHDLGFLLDGF